MFKHNELNEQVQFVSADDISGTTWVTFKDSCNEYHALPATQFYAEYTSI